MTLHPDIWKYDSVLQVVIWFLEFIRSGCNLCRCVCKWWCCWRRTKTQQQFMANTTFWSEQNNKTLNVTSRGSWRKTQKKYNLVDSHVHIHTLPYSHTQTDFFFCEINCSTILTFTSSNKPSKHNARRIMKKGEKKGKKRKSRNHCVMVWCCYSSSEHCAFVTVIRPIWTTCCKHPEGSECY